MTIEFSKHALRQMEIRRLSEEVILSVIYDPKQILIQDSETSIYTKLINESGNIYLYRVFVNINKKPPLIITAYKTSKIDKYGNPLR
jgi:hypothetical protein